MLLWMMFKWIYPHLFQILFNFYQIAFYLRVKIYELTLSRVFINVN